MVGLGSRIKQKRKERHMTQQQLADMINVTKVSICCYENGTRSPELANLIGLAESLEVDFMWLLGMEKKVKYGKDSEKEANVSENDIKLIRYLKKNNKDLYNSLVEEATKKVNS